MSHGGKRPNSGPKKPMSPYGEKTSVIRVPISIKADVLDALEVFKTRVKGNVSRPSFMLVKSALHATELALPIYSGKVSAGQSRFPSPAQDYEQEELDLNKHLVSNPPATFFFRVGNSYDSMIDVGILPNALLIVDRSITPKSSDIVIAEVEGELMVKRLYKWRGAVELRSENKEQDYPAITFIEDQELVVWGVVTFNVNAMK
jgi:DNA polymerase V